MHNEQNVNWKQDTISAISGRLLEGILPSSRMFQASGSMVLSLCPNGSRPYGSNIPLRFYGTVRALGDDRGGSEAVAGGVRNTVDASHIAGGHVSFLLYRTRYRCSYPDRVCCLPLKPIP